MAEATPSSPPAALPRSPFAGVPAGDWPDRDGRIGVRLSAGTIPSVTQISTWPSGVDGLTQALGSAVGATLPARTGETLHLPLGLLVRSGPEEFLLLSEQTVDVTARLRQTIRSDVGSVTDLSHARCRVRIEGEKCCDTLSKLFALDLRSSQFPLDQARLTGHHHLPCMLHRIGDNEFDMVVFSTYARDQLATLIDAALEYGVSLAPGGDSAR